MRPFVFILSLLTSSLLFAQKTILHCGQLIDVKMSTVQKEMSIIIEGNRIADVQKGYASATANDKVVDLKNRTVMPGLIDMHVHLEGETNPNRFLQQFTQNPADIAFQSAVYAERTLMTGFTTDRDLGGTGVNI